MQSQPNPTTQPSQAAREAAWKLRPYCYGPHDHERWMAGVYDALEHIQIFARFERDTEKRVRESLAGERDIGGQHGL